MADLHDVKTFEYGLRTIQFNRFSSSSAKAWKGLEDVRSWIANLSTGVGLDRYFGRAMGQTRDARPCRVRPDILDTRD